MPLHPLLTSTLRLTLYLPAAVFITNHLASLHLVRGRSMSPTLDSDIILASRVSPAQNLRRGEVVLFRTPTDPEKVAIKRVIGLEGDVVRVRNSGWGNGGDVGLVRVGEGSVWVEGDEGFRSVDSNNYGAIPKALITAKVTHIVWPVGRAGRVKEVEGRFGAVKVRAEDRVD